MEGVFALEVSVIDGVVGVEGLEEKLRILLG